MQHLHTAAAQFPFEYTYITHCPFPLAVRIREVLGWKSGVSGAVPVAGDVWELPAAFP